MARGKDGGAPKGGKKNRKHGRNKKWCTLYEKLGTRQKNKAKRLARHLLRHPFDKQARKAQ